MAASGHAPRPLYCSSSPSTLRSVPGKQPNNSRSIPWEYFLVLSRLRSAGENAPLAPQSAFPPHLTMYPQARSCSSLPRFTGKHSHRLSSQELLINSRIFPVLSWPFPQAQEGLCWPLVPLYCSDRSPLNSRIGETEAPPSFLPWGRGAFPLGVLLCP